MARLAAVDLAVADPYARALLGRVERTFGRIPNMTRAMANSPAVLDAYLSFSDALSKGRLPAVVQEQIAFVAAVANECGYCVMARAVLGARAKFSVDNLVAGYDAGASGLKVAAALRFANAIAVTQGLISDADLADVCDAGYDDGEIGEIVAAVALNSFIHFFNSVNDTDLDFP